jgi:hypothetical protein
MICSSSGCLWQQQNFALATVDDNFALATVDDAADMVRPERQCGPHLALVVTAIINAPNTTAVAAVVIKNRFNDVRHDA